MGGKCAMAAECRNQDPARKGNIARIVSAFDLVFCFFFFFFLRKMVCFILKGIKPSGPSLKIGRMQSILPRRQLLWLPRWQRLLRRSFCPKMTMWTPISP